jgi:hypothetical protein
MTTFEFNPTTYAPAIARLLREPWVPPLGTGHPNPATRARPVQLAADAPQRPVAVCHRVEDEAGVAKLLFGTQDAFPVRDLAGGGVDGADDPQSVGAYPAEPESFLR